jgi:hypothetical protein
MFFLPHSVQTGAGAHPASYTMGIGRESGWDVKLTTYVNPVLRSRMAELYPPLPVCLHGVVLN